MHNSWLLPSRDKRKVPERSERGTELDTFRLLSFSSLFGRRFPGCLFCLWGPNHASMKALQNKTMACTEGYKELEQSHKESNSGTFWLVFMVTKCKLSRDGYVTLPRKLTVSSPLMRGSCSSSSLHIDGPCGGLCTARAVSGRDCF